MHEQRALVGAAHHVVVDLVGGEDAVAFLDLVFLAHAGPDVGVDGVGAVGGGVGIVADRHLRAAVLRRAHRLVDDARVGLVALRRADADVGAQLDRGVDQRVAGVVAVADVRQRAAPHRAPLLRQREEVRQRLAWVHEVRQAVDDRDVGVQRQFLQRFVLERARDDAVHPALQVLGHVLHRLARAQARVAMVHEHGAAAHVLHADVEGEARAQRVLLEDHREALVLEHLRVRLAPGLQGARGGEDALDVVRRQRRRAQQVLLRERGEVERGGHAAGGVVDWQPGNTAMVWRRMRRPSCTSSAVSTNGGTMRSTSPAVQFTIRPLR